MSWDINFQGERVAVRAAVLAQELPRIFGLRHLGTRRTHDVLNAEGVTEQIVNEPPGENDGDVDPSSTTHADVRAQIVNLIDLLPAAYNGVRVCASGTTTEISIFVVQGEVLTL
jgi:hypothetical protein